MLTNSINLIEIEPALRIENPRQDMINVTKTFLPPLEEYQHFLQRAWEAKWITNRGALVLELEEKLKQYLAVANIIIW